MFPRQVRDTGTPFQVLAYRIERSPFSDTAEAAGYIIAKRIAEHKLRCTPATVDRIFALFNSQRRPEVLAGIEDGSIPPSLQTLSQFAYQSTWDCLIHLADVCAQNPSLSQIRDAFITNLDVIVRWFSVMIDLSYGRLAGTHRFIATLRPQFSSTIAALLLNLTALIGPLIYSDLRLIGIIVKTWILNAKYPNDVPRLAPAQVFYRCLLHYRSQASGFCDDRILESFDEIDVDCDSVADVALKYLRETSQGQGWDPIELYTNLEIIHYFYMKIDPLKQALLQNNIGIRVMKVMQKITRVLHEQDPDPYEIHIPILGYSIWFLYHIAKDGDTISWVIEWIHSGLLQMLLLCDHWMERLRTFNTGFTRALVNFFRKLLPRLCIFKSFVVVLANELAAHEELGIGTDLRDPFLQPFVSVLTKLAKAQAKLARQLRHAPVCVYRVCEGPNCGVRDDDFRFRRCQGCFSEYYCSVECQRDDWSYHKERCHNLQLQFSDLMRADISSSDMKALKKFIHHSLNIMILDPQYRADFEQSIRRQVHVMVEYKEPPLDISVEMIEDGPPGIYVTATVHKGGYTRSIFFITTLAELFPGRSQQE
ncbi:hypothetical protein QCA50_005251 [Cerrena zonata]|uniref:MYND-type domain-containing protein n=1 Tax=Cerrena zonata TaxID=2478898 RepID=A0AAW0GJ20_9APHY